MQSGRRIVVLAGPGRVGRVAARGTVDSRAEPLGDHRRLETMIKSSSGGRPVPGCCKRHLKSYTVHVSTRR
jgi:hypothetical protein